MRALRDTELEALGRFYESHDQVTPDAFYQYADFLTQSSVVQGWGWAPAVAAADTKGFEQAARAAGAGNFSIWQQGANGNRDPAAGRAVYYPVFLITPAAINAYAVGFDLGSEPVRSAAIAEALRSGLTTGSDPITLIQDNAGYRALLVLRPVYDRERSGLLRGFVFAFLRVEKLLESAGPDTATTQLAISLLRPDGSSEPLAGSGAGLKPVREAFCMVRPVLAFDKTFALTARASSEFVRLHPARGGVSVAMLGVLLTAALTAVFALIFRNRSIQDEAAAGHTLAYPVSGIPSAACRNRMPKRRRKTQRVRFSGHADRQV
jgi:CHASE1-domain containing sensor protein